MPDATKALGRGLKTWAGIVLLAAAGGRRNDSSRPG